MRITVGMSGGVDSSVAGLAAETRGAPSDGHLYGEVEKRTNRAFVQLLMIMTCETLL